MTTNKEKLQIQKLSIKFNQKIQNITQDENISKYFIIEPIINFSINNTVLDSNLILKKYKSLANKIKKIIDIPKLFHELDNFYQQKEQTFLNLNDSQKGDFLISLYQDIIQNFSIKRADKDGVVYTPKELTNFIIRITNQLYQKHFQKSIYTPNLSILDPFVGSGNFIESLIYQAPNQHISYKLSHDIYANEIDPISYLIASLNIENAHFQKTNQYVPYHNLQLVDTFSLYKENGYYDLNLTANNEKYNVIIGNPPYNSKQKTSNDNNQNDKHPYLNEAIQNSYACNSMSTNKTALYDSYIKAIKWASFFLEEDGIIAFITNNSFLNKLSTSGMRACLNQDFNYIYIVDLDGNTRKFREGKVFNVFNIRIGVAIFFLVKKKNSKNNKIFYKLYPDNVPKEQTFDTLNKTNLNHINFKEIVPINIFNLNKQFQKIVSQEWFQGENSKDFYSFIEIGNRSYKNTPDSAINSSQIKTYFKSFSTGIQSGRDAWIYSFNKKSIKYRCSRLINNFNQQVKDILSQNLPKDQLHNHLNYDPTFIKWSRAFIDRLKKAKYIEPFDKAKITIASYRPFIKKFIYFDHNILERQSKQKGFFSGKNIAIVITAPGSNEGYFGVFLSPIYACADLLNTCRLFPFYSDGKLKKENITDWILNEFKDKYKNYKITKKKIFFYIYAILINPLYQSQFNKELFKDYPRIPLLKEFPLYVSIGKKLMKTHLYYEKAKEYDKIQIEYLKDIHNLSDQELYHVQKMKLIKYEDSISIVYNQYIKINNIPLEALNYKVGPYTALKWILGSYQIKKDKLSGIIEDPNNPKDPKYIFRLLKKMIQVTLETNKLLNQLPKHLNYLNLKTSLPVVKGSVGLSYKKNGKEVYHFSILLKKKKKKNK